jgi:hypothetical protein
MIWKVRIKHYPQDTRLQIEPVDYDFTEERAK